MYVLLAPLASPRFETVLRTLWTFSAAASTWWVLASDAIVLPVDVRVVFNGVQRPSLTRLALRKPAIVAHPPTVVAPSFEPLFLIVRAEVAQMLPLSTGVTFVHLRFAQIFPVLHVAVDTYTLLGLVSTCHDRDQCFLEELVVWTVRLAPPVAKRHIRFRNRPPFFQAAFAINRLLRTCMPCSLHVVAEC